MNKESQCSILTLSGVYVCMYLCASLWSHRKTKVIMKYNYWFTGWRNSGCWYFPVLSDIPTIISISSFKANVLEPHFERILLTAVFLLDHSKLYKDVWVFWIKHQILYTPIYLFNNHHLIIEERHSQFQSIFSLGFQTLFEHS